MATVFVTSEDPHHDYSTAYAFGDRLVGVFPSGQIHLNPQRALHEARGVLGIMKPDDFLALVGDPVKIAICAVVAAERNGRVRMLRWNRQTAGYIEIETDFQKIDEF